MSEVRAELIVIASDVIFELFNQELFKIILQAKNNKVKEKDCFMSLSLALIKLSAKVIDSFIEDDAKDEKMEAVRSISEGLKDCMEKLCEKED